MWQNGKGHPTFRQADILQVCLLLGALNLKAAVVGACKHCVIRLMTARASSAVCNEAAPNAQLLHLLGPAQSSGPPLHRLAGLVRRLHGQVINSSEAVTSEEKNSTPLARVQVHR